MTRMILVPQWSSATREGTVIKFICANLRNLRITTLRAPVSRW